MLAMPSPVGIWQKADRRNPKHPQHRAKNAIRWLSFHKRCLLAGVHQLPSIRTADAVRAYPVRSTFVLQVLDTTGNAVSDYTERTLRLQLPPKCCAASKPVGITSAASEESELVFDYLREHILDVKTCRSDLLGDE